MTQLIVALTLSALSLSVFAQPPVSKITSIVRENQWHTRVSYEFWSGEYPSPVIDLSAKVVGKSTIKVERSYETPGKTAMCTVDNGVYHPWSTTTNATYITIAALKEYKLTRAFDFESNSYDEKSGDIKTEKIKAQHGDVVTRVVYLGEGYCSAELIYQPNLQRKEVDFFCGDIDDTSIFKETKQSQSDNFSEQWIAFTCAEGFTGYIQDKQLLASPGARPGRILSHGEVGPAEDIP